MWLTNSSIGRKFVMSITGLALILFLLFHGSMNLALVFSEDAYNWICEMLGANWYALVASMGLAVLVVIHFADATFHRYNVVLADASCDKFVAVDMRYFLIL